MNPAAATSSMEPSLPLQPPQLAVAQPPRSSFSCDRHPEEQFTGFCPECLCERLAGLDKSSTAAPRKSNAGATTAAALRALFRGSSSGAAAGVGGEKTSNRNSTSSKPSSSFFAELRRTKSFSASKGEGFSGVFEPQRKSCDVRVRNTLWTLFNQDDDRKGSKKETRVADAEAEAKTLALSSMGAPVEDCFEIEDVMEDEEVVDCLEEEEDDEIRVSEEALNGVVSPVFEDSIEEIVEEEEEGEIRVCTDEGLGEAELIEEEVVEEVVMEDLKPMKEHIDLDSQCKKPAGRDFKEIAGSFWSAASVFSKKLQKWRRKQKLKKQGHGSASVRLPVDKRLRRRQCRETQSEIADYGYGRRSCDTDPRFSLDAGRMSLDAGRMSLDTGRMSVDAGRMSLDAGRMSLDAGRMSLDAGRMSLDAGRMSLDAGRVSFDDPRYSFDEPRASWDGYLIGGRTFPRLPPMLSVVEDAPVPVSRTDNQIPVEAPMNGINEDEGMPGGTTQTKEYYSDSSSRRRKSLDRSNSIRKTAAAVVAEIDEMKSVSNNSKVSPATLDSLQGSKLLGTDRDLRDSNSNSLRDDCSETFDLGFRDPASVIGNGDRKPASKKSRRWKVWNIWGFIYRRNGAKDEDDDRFSRLNGVERSFSESWQEFRREANGDAKEAFNRRVLRSNSSVSSRNSYNLGAFGSVRKSSVEANGNCSKKRKDEYVLERNRSARYSPNNIENGLLRFYLTPLRGSRRSGSGKNRLNNSHSIARSVLRLY